MSKLNQYTVHFAGLKEGKYDFKFEIGKELFAYYQNSDITDAAILVEAIFEKKTSHLSFQFNIEGTIQTTCDRCLETIKLEINDSPELYINFGEETSDLTDIDDTMTLARSEDKIDLKKHFYDYIILNLPIKKIHPDDEHGNSTCNPEMIKKLEQYLSHSENDSEIDPRWEKLKNLYN